MPATITLPHPIRVRNLTPDHEHAKTTELPLVPRHGVATLWGYGISVTVEKGHLILKDGVGDERRAGRFPRVNHGLRRLVVIGADGMVSLAALRWLADQDAAFVMLDRDGSVLLTTGPVTPSDARLRRAQACAPHSGIAEGIVRELIRQKLTGQESIARDKLGDDTRADAIAGYRTKLNGALRTAEIRLLESQGGAVYWAAWRSFRVKFPKSELHRIPEHWRMFGPRHSPVSRSCRNAANPANAMLNYLYAILESETRLAAATLGLDPGLGLLHVDVANRDSLVCDLMEPVRPKVDAFLADWLLQGPLRRNGFFEQRDGTCRLMPVICERLAETAPMWQREVAPVVEWFAREVSAASPKPGGLLTTTRLTNRRWREARGYVEPRAELPVPQPESVCLGCGVIISSGRKNCEACAVEVAKENLAKGRSRQRPLTAESKKQLGRNQSRQNDAKRAWDPAELPAWLDNEFYVTRVQPRLAKFTRAAIASALDISIAWAADIRGRNRIPHPRHWARLARLVGMPASNELSPQVVTPERPAPRVQESQSDAQETATSDQGQDLGYP